MDENEKEAFLLYQQLAKKMSVVFVQDNKVSLKLLIKQDYSWMTKVYFCAA